MSAGLIVSKASSAGILVYRRHPRLEVLLVHPGGPFWAKKDDGAWSIPKGEFAEGEDPVAAARRELAEETGLVTEGELRPLGSVKQAGGKVVHGWALEGNLDASAIRSNTFSMEWPPRSGRMQQFPEVDRAAWFSIDEARIKLLQGQLPLLDALIALVRV
jgi:predicted NUDIX family NTP pyrophosphohydrolase